MCSLTGAVKQQMMMHPRISRHLGLGHYRGYDIRDRVYKDNDVFLVNYSFSPFQLFKFFNDTDADRHLVFSLWWPFILQLS